MQESYRVKLKDPQRFENLVSAVAGLPGVDTVQDLRKFLDPLFKALNALELGSYVAAGLLLVAALMQISNTIRLAAYARRREIGIMRLVGASSFYIQLPFLLEAVLAALIGAVLACGTLWIATYLVVNRFAKQTFQVWEWVQFGDAIEVTLYMVVVGLILAVIPTFLTTRKYLKV
jgi:cell division transport system permease protein